jgi:hypothetical protein
LKTLLLTATSLLLGLLLLEGCTRIYYAIGNRIPPHPDPGVRDEWRWAREHLDIGKAEVSGLSGFDPTLGWREPGTLADWINRKSWNPPADPFIDDGLERTLFLGDSFTAGLYVEPHQAFASEYGARYKPEGRTFNLGVSGYGLDQMLLLYRDTGPRLHADTVVLGFYLGGFERALSGFTYYAKPQFEISPQSGKLTVTGQPVPGPQILYDRYLHGEARIGEGAVSLLWRASGAAWQRWRMRGVFRSEHSQEWALFAALFREFLATAQHLGDRPVLLLIPTRLESFDGSVEQDLEARTLKLGCELGFVTVALATPFIREQTNNRDAPLFRPREDGGHFSVQGHRLVAQILAAALAGRDSCADHP